MSTSALFIVLVTAFLIWALRFFNVLPILKILFGKIPDVQDIVIADRELNSPLKHTTLFKLMENQLDPELAKDIQSQHAYDFTSFLAMYWQVSTQRALPLSSIYQMTKESPEFEGLVAIDMWDKKVRSFDPSWRDVVVHYHRELLAEKPVRLIEADQQSSHSTIKEGTVNG